MFGGEVEVDSSRGEGRRNATVTLAMLEVLKSNRYLFCCENAFYNFLQHYGGSKAFDSQVRVRVRVRLGLGLGLG